MSNVLGGGFTRFASDVWGALKFHPKIKSCMSAVGVEENLL